MSHGMPCSAGAQKSDQRLLWIGQLAVEEGAGDAIYDRKMIAACRALGTNVECLQLRPVSRAHELANLARGVPYYRARYDSAQNHSAIAQAAKRHTRAVCSWEPLDALAARCPIPTLPILHNVSSHALRAMYPDNRLVSLAALRVALWERRLYGSRKFPAIVALSELDRRRVAKRAGTMRTLLAPPGMPPCTELPAEPAVRRELLLWGSFDWAPKRRDVLAFARAYERVPQRLPVLAERLPAEAEQRLAVRPVPKTSAPAVRFGLITDRFEAGFKLKGTAYLADNAIVLSFVDLASDYAGIEDYGYFVRHLRSVEEIARHVAEVAAADPAQLRTRFEAFKQRCAARFSWQASAQIVLAASEKSVLR